MYEKLLNNFQWMHAGDDRRLHEESFYFLLASLPLLLVLLALWLALASSCDVEELFRIHRAASPHVKLIMRLVSDWGNAVFYVIYGIILLVGWWHRDRRLLRQALAYVVVQIVVSLLAVHLVKIATGRPRPGINGPAMPFSMSPEYNSLPSGHTAEICGAGLPLAVWSRRVLMSLGLGCVIALEGFSRIYLGQHHVSDVFFGWTLGVFAGAAIYTFGKDNA